MHTQIDISFERERIPASKVLKLTTLYANFQLTILTNFFEGNASEYWKIMKQMGKSTKNGLTL